MFVTSRNNRYDDLGHMDSEISDWNTASSSDFDYDAVTGELTSETLSSYASARTWEYDDNGNRVETYEPSMTTTSEYETDAYNRVVCDGYYRYEYDAEGNRTDRYRWTDYDQDGEVDWNANEISDWTEYTWDYRNRLVQVEYDAAYDPQNLTPDTTVTFGYDYLNRWVSTKVDTAPAAAGGETSEYLVYNPQAVSDTVSPWDVGATELDEVGQVVLRLEGEGDFVAGEETARVANRYLWTPAVDEILADEQVHWDGSSDYDTDTILWPATDIRGSVRDLVEFDDATGDATVFQHRTYDAFGALTEVWERDGYGYWTSVYQFENAAITHLFGFTGRPGEVTTGLQNNLHRWYDASVGSWINEDPIGFEGGDANLYRYCGNDPVNGTDPNGLWFGFLGQGLDAASDACSWAWNGAVGISQDIGTSLGDVWGGLNYGVPDAMINRKLREIGTRHIARGGDDFDTYRNSYRAPESTANAISGLANYYLEFLGWGAGCVSPSKIAQEASEVAANRAMREWADATLGRDVIRRIRSGATRYGAPSRLGAGLAGEHSGPWASAAGDIVVDGLPGPGGILLPRAATPAEMAALSGHFEGIEFLLLLRQTADGPVYRLLSGRAGQMGQVTANFDNVWELLMHTHPGGSNFASPKDMALLADLGQMLSYIVLPNGSVFPFTQRFPNTTLPFGGL